MKWGWREGVGLEDAESEEGRGRTTRFNLKMTNNGECFAFFISMGRAFFLIQNNWGFY